MDINYMDVNDFVEIGFLQEANRQFFHPLGLALEVTVEEDGSSWISHIWDYRDDPEGMLFSPSSIDGSKIHRVAEERKKHEATRHQILGHKGPQELGDELAPVDPPGEATKG